VVSAIAVEAKGWANSAAKEINGSSMDGRSDFVQF